MWLHCLGVAVVLFVGLGGTELFLSPSWLRLPLALFLAGMMLSMLGLFWAGVTQDALRRQLASHDVGRSHWVPGLFAIVSYALALIVFAAACWALLGVASLSRYLDGVHGSPTSRSNPGFHHRQGWSNDQDSAYLRNLKAGAVCRTFDTMSGKQHTLFMNISLLA